LDMTEPAASSPVDRNRAQRLAAVLAAGDGVDLHSHSRHSDGDWLPADLITDARKIGLSLLSLTDHDTVAGQAAAREAANEAGMLFLNGMEVSLKVQDRLYHVLCYDFDPDALTWKRFAIGNQARRERYQIDQFDQMKDRGYDVSPDLARDEAGRLLPQPLAVALHRAGNAESFDAAQRIVRAVSIQPKIELTYQDIAEFGDLLEPGDAIFSVAHPARHQAGVSVRLSEADLLTLKETIPLVALEATHPYHSAADVAYFANLAAKNGLAVTCGSDAHGERQRRPLQHLSASLCADFLGLVRDRWESRAPRPLVALSR
jgi:predicted metal-dependent phosphoesterase TrpH